MPIENLTDYIEIVLSNALSILFCLLESVAGAFRPTTTWHDSRVTSSGRTTRFVLLLFSGLMPRSKPSSEVNQVSRHVYKGTMVHLVVVVFDLKHINSDINHKQIKHACSAIYPPNVYIY